ncbi:MAG: hypothetical protein CL420_04185 [Acidimicrobiaceae bacterium]|jgi:hypothetical protein|nr:hypothetical protein [Acidimicrobiaceae bacterium]
MKKNSKSLASPLVFLSILCGLFLFFSGVVSAGSTSGEWQSARSDAVFDPTDWSFEPKAIAVWSEPLLEGQAFKVSPQSFGNHSKVGFRVYVVSESAFKSSGQTIGDYIAAGDNLSEYHLATLLWIGNQIDHDGNTADFWRAGFRPEGWNPNADGFNRDLNGTDAPLHFFMFDDKVWYSEGATHEPDVGSTRVDDMDAHGYSDPIMFFGLAHKRNDQTNTINAGNAPNSDRFSIVSNVNLDNDCDGTSNWEDADDNDGSCESGESEPAPTTTTTTTTTTLPPVVPTTTLGVGSPVTTTVPPTTTLGVGSPVTTTVPPTTTLGVGSVPTTTVPPTTTLGVGSVPTTTVSLTTTTTNPQPPSQSPGPDEPDPSSASTLPPTSSSTTTSTSTPDNGDDEKATPSPEPKDCDCNDGWPWWAWFLLGNGCWMTIRYIIKHMKENEKVE